jgi:hypothetical protein
MTNQSVRLLGLDEELESVTLVGTAEGFMVVKQRQVNGLTNTL